LERKIYNFQKICNIPFYLIYCATARPTNVDEFTKITLSQVSWDREKGRNLKENKLRKGIEGSWWPWCKRIKAKGFSISFSGPNRYPSREPFWQYQATVRLSGVQPTSVVDLRRTYCDFEFLSL